jgi:hypothetical protein
MTTLVLPIVGVLAFALFAAHFNLCDWFTHEEEES